MLKKKHGICIIMLVIYLSHGVKIGWWFSIFALSSFTHVNGFVYKKAVEKMPDRIFYNESATNLLFIKSHSTKEKTAYEFRHTNSMFVRGHVCYMVLKALHAKVIWRDETNHAKNHWQFTLAMSSISIIRSSIHSCHNSMEAPAHSALNSGYPFVMHSTQRVPVNNIPDPFES